MGKDHEKRRILQVAQIGCGAHAAGQDMPNYALNPQIECRWCCDVSGERATELAARFGVSRVTTDFREVMADPEVDMVKLATSHEAHLPLIEAAAASGKHVYCEKPLAMSATEALHIIRAVRRGNIKLCVNLNRRMAPALQELRRRWREHRDDPRHQPWRYIEVERDQYPEERRTQFLVRVQDDTVSYRPMHLDPLRGGGQVIGESVHWLDLACWWFAPQRPVEIQAWGSTRFSHGIQVTFTEGDTATILFHCGGTFDYPKELYEVTSQGALLRCESFVENQYYGVPGWDRDVFPFLGDPAPEVGNEGGLSGYLCKYRAAVAGIADGKHLSGLSVDKGHRAMLDGFVQAILHDQASPCDEMAGYLSTYLAGLAIQSIEIRQSLPVLLERVEFTVG